MRAAVLLAGLVLVAAGALLALAGEVIVGLGLLAGALCLALACAGLPPPRKSSGPDPPTRAAHPVVAPFVARRYVCSHCGRPAWFGADVPGRYVVTCRRCEGLNEVDVPPWEDPSP